jgi:hypothetical protein
MARNSVSAKVPQGCDAVVEVSGKEVEEDLMRKGRRWDLWMNVGEIHIYGAPSLYLIMSSTPRLLPREGGNYPWGYNALGQKVTFKGRHMKKEEHELFTEFIQLKEGLGEYGRFPGTLEIHPVNEVQAMVQGAFLLPTRIPPGIYQVCVTVIKKGRVMECRCTSLEAPKPPEWA